MQITRDFIASVGVNEASVKNGADLVRKKQFKHLTAGADLSFLSGECTGSGKNPYRCSADFIQEDAPVFRCTCPSRQIPCKHVIGLLWAYMEGIPFTTGAVPEDIREKRENKEKRAVKTKEKLENTGKKGSGEKTAAWKKSAVKKIDAQLTGIQEAEKILRSLVQSGIAATDVKITQHYQTLAKQLDSYFIPGIQNEINDLLGMTGGGDDPERVYVRAAEKLCQIQTLLDKSKTYLAAKKEAPDKPDTESEIEERIGYAWKLEELIQHGLYETDARLAQLCFHVRREEDKRQFVDEGFYISLQSGKIYKTRSYRPFKAAKYIKEEDSVFSLLRVPQLCVYPSASLNPRVRWEAFTLEDLPPETCKTIKSHARGDYAEIIKQVKNQLKNLLLFPHPAVLAQYAKISKITRDGGVLYAVNDAAGRTITLRPSAYCENGFLFLLERLTRAEAENNAALLLFDNDIETGELCAQPLALVTDEKIIRLLY